LKKKKLDELTADHERWDNHIASAEHTQFVSEDEEKEIDAALGLQPISLRLRKTLIEQFKAFAKLEGIGYQPMMRLVLTEYARQNEHKLVALLSGQQASVRADKLFVEAIRAKRDISKMAPLSNERVIAESNFSKSLLQAQALFAQATKDSKNPVLVQHARLRLTQIADLCKETVSSDHSKRQGKKNRQAG
jgi:predicted DNA binding CopG/RHH family protein